MRTPDPPLYSPGNGSTGTAETTDASRIQRARPILVAAYVAAVSGVLLYLNFRINLEWVAVILFGAALFYGKGQQFVRDWSVFFIVLLAWQFTSPLSTRFGFPWHATELVDFDRLVFGGNVPAVWLQHRLHHPGVVEPWDILSATVYMSHFLTPLLCGFSLWLTDRALFQKFAIAFVVLAFAGFITYIAYPSVPPYMASQPLQHLHGTYVVAPGGHVYLPGHVVNLFQITAGHWFSPYHGYVSLTFKGMNLLNLHYDPVAEIPSEHAAFPLLFFLFLRRQFGRYSYFVLIYVALVIFAILYLGMHYFLDALVGFAYAAAAYVLVIHWYPLAALRLRRLLHRQPNVALHHEEV
jgi:membrane-associated phospholipid phosphatase